MKGVFMRGFYALFMRLAGTFLMRRVNWSEWRDLNPRPLAPQSAGHKNASTCHGYGNRLSWKGARTAVIVSLLCLSPILTQAEAYIAFEPIRSGNLSFESVALNVDGSVLFSPANGAVFYKDGTVQRGLPVWGSCYSYPAVYICTFETGEYSFRIRLEKATKKGLVWPVSSNFDAMGAREAALIELTPPQAAR